MFALLMTLFLACSPPTTLDLGEAVGGAAPRITAGGDAADRDCGVVLRSVQRDFAQTDYEVACAGGDCRYVWRGRIEVDEAIADEVTVHLLYRAGSGATWWEVEAQQASGGSPGYRPFDFALSEHLFGPGTDPADIELVAFARDGVGNRLFDHNRFPDDLTNTELGGDNGYQATDGGVCQPAVGTLWFGDDWSEQRHGTLRQGGYLEVRYDLDRLPQCRNTHNGYPAWGTEAFVRFFPGGQITSGSVVDFATPYGVPTNDVVEAPLVVAIPDDATAVELWFHNESGAGSQCETWDSNFGANYTFDIWPSADDPRCLGVEKETGQRGEDPRMAHNAPYCLGYDLDDQYDADHCELVVDGFGDGHVGHYGIPFDWYVAYLRTGDLDGEVLEVGLWVRTRDRVTGVEAERFLLGLEEAPGVWRTGIATHVTAFMGTPGTALDVDAMAFFVDVRRPSGGVERRWQSRHGADYHPSDALSLPTTLESIPYGHIDWAHPDAAIYETRRTCD